MEEKFKYQGKKFLLEWNEENKILAINMGGSHNKEDAEDFGVGLKDFFGKKEKLSLLKILIDARKLEKSDHEARRLYAGIAKEAAKKMKGKVALCSANVFVRMVGNFVVMAASGDIEMKIFSGPDEGLKWLKKDN